MVKVGLTSTVVPASFSGISATMSSVNSSGRARLAVDGSIEDIFVSNSLYVLTKNIAACQTHRRLRLRLVYILSPTTAYCPNTLKNHERLSPVVNVLAELPDCTLERVPQEAYERGTSGSSSRQFLKCTWIKLQTSYSNAVWRLW